MRHSGRPVRLSAALLLAACGDTVGPAPPPVLRITSITPEYDAWEVETGATVAIAFNQAIDPATLTAATFQVNLEGGSQLVAKLSYDAATRTARATAPLLPGPTYQIVVTTGVRTPAGAPLAATRRSRFTTHAWQAVTVDTAENVGYLDMVVDAIGRLHVSYSAIRPNRLKYATCAPGCDAASSWHAVTMDTASGKNDLAVDAGGRVHVIYHDYDNYAL